MRRDRPYPTLTGRPAEPNRERPQVHTFDEPQPMQKNSCLSGSKATGSPHPQDRGVGARVACTTRDRPRRAACSGRCSEVVLPLVMAITGPKDRVIKVLGQ